MRTTAGMLAVAAVLLAGCASDEGDGGGSPDGERAAGPLAGLDGDTLCAMVDRAVVEKQFGEPIPEVMGREAPPEQRDLVACFYMSKGFLDADIDHINEELEVTTNVTVSDAKADTAKAALDAYLTNDGETVAYQPVDGLGAEAGYAGSELEVRAGGGQLAAIIEIDGAFIEIVTKANPKGTLEQLRPIAAEVVEEVETELR